MTHEPDPSQAVLLAFAYVEAGVGVVPPRIVDETPYEWHRRIREIDAEIAARHDASPTAVAVRWVLDRPGVAAVLLGTLYPLAVDALGLGKISVGPPYFNAVFIPLTAPLAMLVGIGALARWKRDTFENIWPKVRIPFVLALAAGVLYPIVLTPGFVWQAAFGMVLGNGPAAVGKHLNHQRVPVVKNQSIAAFATVMLARSE